MTDTDSSTLTGLVSHYSPSGQEAGAVGWLVERMKFLRFGRSFIDAAGNAIGIVGNGPRQIVLLGHIDTVPGEITVREEGGVLYGRGSVDAKGALSCFVDAVSQVGEADGWQFVVIGAVEEERESEGARFVSTKYKPDFAVIGEPNHWDRIALGYKGSAWANLTIKLGQTHGASGHETACESAVEAWLEIKAFAASFNAGKGKVFDQLMPTLRGLNSGSDGFEQWARLAIGVRLPLDVTPENWYAKIRELIQSNPGRTDRQVLVEPTGFAVPAWEGEKNTPLVRAFLAGIRSQGGEPRFVYKMGTADLNILAPVWKCPALVYGPGDSSLDHTPGERIDLADYSKAVTVLRETLKRLIA